MANPQAVAVMDLDEVQAVIDRATSADIPLRILFAALDRLTQLGAAQAGGQDRVVQYDSPPAVSWPAPSESVAGRATRLAIDVDRGEPS